ncbi:unnamed protein product [Closterium sp. Yama58-4]|nr:unnamed protein product [Closterium sp. Yama58-4]
MQPRSPGSGKGGGLDSDEDEATPVDAGYEVAEELPEEASAKNRRYDDVDVYEYELPADFEDEEIDEDEAFTEEEKKMGMGRARKPRGAIALKASAVVEESLPESELNLTAAKGAAQSLPHPCLLTALPLSTLLPLLPLHSMYSQEASGCDSIESISSGGGESTRVRVQPHSSQGRINPCLAPLCSLSCPCRLPFPCSSSPFPSQLESHEAGADLSGLAKGSAEGSAAAGLGVGGSALAGLKKQMRRIEASGAPDTGPLPTVVRERLERKAAYKASSKEAAKWLPLVQQNRQAPSLNLIDEMPALPTLKSTDRLVNKFRPQSEMEKEVAAALAAAGVGDDRRIAHGEALALNKMSVEEARERMNRLAKMRSLLLQHEAKAKRVKKIKSKTFHKMERKAEERKRKKGLAAGGEAGGEEEWEDKEAAREAAIKQEYLRAKERMTLRHKNTSKWAKRIIERGMAAKAAVGGQGTREAIAEQLRTHAMLTRKIHSATIGRGEEDEDEEDEDGEGEGEWGEEGSGGESGGSEGEEAGGKGGGGEKEGRRLVASAKARILRALEGKGGGDGGRGMGKRRVAFLLCQYGSGEDGEGTGGKGGGGSGGDGWGGGGGWGDEEEGERVGGGRRVFGNLGERVVGGEGQEERDEWVAVREEEGEEGEEEEEGGGGGGEDGGGGRQGGMGKSGVKAGGRGEGRGEGRMLKEEREAARQVKAMLGAGKGFSFSGLSVVNNSASAPVDVSLPPSKGDNKREAGAGEGDLQSHSHPL